MNHTGNPRLGLFGATLGFFIGFAAVALFGPTARKFQDVMQLTPVMVGFLVAVPSLTGSLLRIPFAAWVDTTGGRKPFLVLLGLSIAGMLGLTLLVWQLYPDRLSPNLYPLLLVLGMLSGCGIATFSVGVGQVAYWFPQSRQGSALGTYAGIGNLAPGLFSFILPLALTSLGLVGSYTLWLAFLVLGAVLYYFTGRNAWYFQFREQGANAARARELALRQGQEIFPAKSLVESLSSSARVAQTWILVAIYFATFGGFIALTAWLPTYWTEFFAVSSVTAGGLTALYSILASLVRVAGGSFADKLGGEKTARLALLTTLLGAIVMSVSHSLGLSVAGTIIMALGMGVGNAAVFKLVPQAVPHAVGGASGWVGGLGAFGGFAIPPVLGIFVRSIGSGGYAIGFATYIALALLSLALTLLLKLKQPARPQPARQSGD